MTRTSAHGSSKALGVMLALVAAAPAGAQQPAEEPSKRLGFGVRPLNSAAGHFDLKARPGDTVRGTLLISNPRRRPITIALRRQDAGTATTGGLEYSDLKPGGTGSWLDLPVTKVRLAPRTERRVVMRARVPADARAGDHFAGIVAYDASELARVRREEAARGGVKLKFISRFAVATRFRVPGPASAQLRPGEIRIETTPSGATIQVGIQNTGDLLVPSSKGQITVTRDGRKILKQPVDIGAFVPKTSISVPLPWEGTPTEGTYHVEGFLHPSNAKAIVFDADVEFGGQESRDLERQTGIQAASSGTPWWVLALVGLLAAIGLVLVVVMRRERRLRAPRAEAAVAAAAPAAPEPRPASVPNGRVDLNSASLEELMSVPGVGRAAAQRVLDYRDEYGNFESVEALAEVDGFDAARIQRLAERVVARPPSP